MTRSRARGYDKGEMTTLNADMLRNWSNGENYGADEVFLALAVTGAWLGCSRGGGMMEEGEAQKGHRKKNHQTVVVVETKLKPIASQVLKSA